MATPVPYEGAPTLAPQFKPTPSVNVSDTPAAFGVNVAEAVGHQGQMIEGAGKELFDRAYAMQELQQHAVANKALADAQDASNQRFVDYRSLEGQAAVDGYKPFVDDLNKIREDGGKNLGPYAGQLYDQESRNSRQRLAFSGAVHSADEQKKFIVGAADASVASSIKNMEVNPNDPATAEAALKNIRDQVAHKWGDIGGMSPAEVKQKQDDAVNAAVNGRVRALAKSDPIGAQKLLDQALKDGDLYGNDVTNLSWYVRNERNTIGSRGPARQAVNESRMNGGPLLRSLLMQESGGRDVHQDIVDKNTLKGTPAQGYFQIIDPTWRRYADAAGVDLREYPTAYGAPYSVQAAVANVIPLNQWGPDTIKKMRGTGATLDLSKTLGENLAANGEGMGSGITPKPTAEDTVRRARAIANQQFPNEPDFADAVENRTLTELAQEKRIVDQTEFDYNQTLWGTIVAGEVSGQPITSPEQLMVDPKNKEAWDYLASNKPEMLERFLNEMRSNASGPKADTPQRQETFRMLYGMMHSDPKEFLAATEDPSKLDLSSKRKDDLVRMRATVQKGEEADPHVKAALSVLYPLLQAVDLKKGGDEDGLNLFTGLLGDQMQQFQQENKRPMKYDEIKTMGAQMLQEMGKGWFGGHGTPWFETITSVPPDVEKIIRGDPVWTKNNIVPSDQQVLQAYIGAQYQEKFGKKTKPTEAATQ